MSGAERPALVEPRSDGRVELRSPEVGLWREGPPVGRILQPGDPLGRVETLGLLRTIVVPPGVSGRVVERTGPGGARPPVGYGTPLVVLDPEAVLGAEASGPAPGAQAHALGLVLLAPVGGRFYPRPGPGKPAFVQVGDVIEAGQTVALVEVMKTFNRVVYGGGGLPARARVLRVLRGDDEDVAAGDPLIEVESA